MKQKKNRNWWTPFKRAVYVNPPLVPGLDGEEVWKNNLYQVEVRMLEGGGRHLSIKRIDRAPVHDWRHFQRIKNELCGPEFEAVELYPAESRLVDTANQYHLWVFPEGKFVPVGFTSRLVTQSASPLFPKAKQRPFDEPPADLEEQERKFEEAMKEQFAQ